LQLFGNDISVAGEITANGGPGIVNNYNFGVYGGGGGAGGGVLLAAPTVVVSGSITTSGGPGGAAPYPSYGTSGGSGRIKLLSTGTPSVTGTLTGVTTQGLLPPIPITSTSHPNSALVYNDGFPEFDISWSQPFPGVQGYYVLVSTTESVPAPGHGQFFPGESASFSSGAFAFPSGMSTWNLQVVPVGAGSAVGTVESFLTVQINTTPPAISSATNPNTAAWVAGGAPYLSWTFPVPSSSVANSYYVLDHYPGTIPGTSATRLSASQTSLQFSGIADGIWFFHLVAQDTRGYFTKAVSHYRLNIGADPGTGSLLGTVVDATLAPVANATVTLNRGLYTTTTDSHGNYTFSGIPALTWEVTATSGAQSATATESVTSGGTTTANLTL
jgi:hypothetical protein